MGNLSGHLLSKIVRKWRTRRLNRHFKSTSKFRVNEIDMYCYAPEYLHLVADHINFGFLGVDAAALLHNLVSDIAEGARNHFPQTLKRKPTFEPCHFVDWLLRIQSCRSFIHLVNPSHTTKIVLSYD